MVVVELLEVDAAAREHSHEKEESLGLIQELATSMAQSGGASAEGEREGDAETSADSASGAVAVAVVGEAGNQGTGVKMVVETAAVVGNAVVGEGDVETGEVVEGVDEGEEADGRAVHAVVATAPV